MTVIADVFPQLPPPKSVVKSMSKKLCFRGRFERQHRKWVKTLLESERQPLYNIY